MSHSRTSIVWVFLAYPAITLAAIEGYSSAAVRLRNDVLEAFLQDKITRVSGPNMTIGQIKKNSSGNFTPNL